MLDANIDITKEAIVHTYGGQETGATLWLNDGGCVHAWKFALQQSMGCGCWCPQATGCSDAIASTCWYMALWYLQCLLRTAPKTLQIIQPQETVHG
jgi:hypothetical protein